MAKATLKLVKAAKQIKSPTTIKTILADFCTGIGTCLKRSLSRAHQPAALQKVDQIPVQAACVT